MKLISGLFAATFALLAPLSTHAEVLWLAKSTWQPGATGSLLSVAAEHWVVTSPEPVDCIQVLPDGVIAVSPNPLAEGVSVNYSTQFSATPLQTAFYGVTLTVEHAPMGMRSIIALGSADFQRASLFASLTREKDLRLGVNSQGGKPTAGTLKGYYPGQPVRVVVQFTAGQPSRLWAAPVGTPLVEETPLIVSEKPANPSQVTHFTIRPDRDLTTKLADIVVAKTFASAAQP